MFVSEDLMDIPEEIINHVLRFVDPQDLIRMQRVSKRFYAITTDRTLWRAVYTTARFPLPPGPFPWQSTRFLQHTLVASSRVARTWTTKPFVCVSKQTFPRPGDEDCSRWVSGRWLITSKGMCQLRVCDVETGANRFLWDHGPYADWAAASVINPLAHFIYVALHLGRARPQDPVKLLEFVVDDDTGNLTFSESMDVPTWSLATEDFVPSICITSGTAPYAYISLCPTNHPRRALIFDPRSREFYKLPRFQTQADVLLHYRGPWLPVAVMVYLTSTHIFVCSYTILIHDNIGCIELIQAFALPEITSVPKGDIPIANDDPLVSQQHVLRELRLSHEMDFLGQRNYTWDVPEPLRDSTIDPITGSINLRFMHTYSSFLHIIDRNVRLVCAEYTLPAHPGSTHPTPIVVPAGAGAVSDDGVPTMTTTTSDLGDFQSIVRCPHPVLPITYRSHDIVSIPGQWSGALVHVSAPGFLRGLCLFSGSNSTSFTGWEYQNISLFVHKLTIDATGELCVAVVGDACSSPLPGGIDLSRAFEYQFDAMHGKIWNTREGMRQLRGKSAYVIDFE